VGGHQSHLRPQPQAPLLRLRRPNRPGAGADGADFRGLAGDQRGAGGAAGGAVKAAGGELRGSPNLFCSLLIFKNCHN
jgi:hypothetical protein